MKTIVTIVALSLMSAVSFAKDPQPFASSGARRVQLLELFSSESCSSCPPADQWFSELKDESGLWKSYVPVVFHVDYWNYLNWHDRFSSAAMTQRQVDLAHTWTVPAVYTPGVIVDGKEWRGWRDSRDHRLPARAAATEIRLSIFKEDNGYRVKAEGLERGILYTVRLAELGLDLKTKVTAGENSGKTLHHDFVVQEWSSEPAELKKPEATFHFKKSGERRAVAAWIERRGDPTPLQATGGFPP